MTEYKKTIAGLTISAAVGATIWLLLWVLGDGESPQRQNVYWSAAYPTMILSALIIGFFLRQGAWRWGVVIVFTQFILVCSIFNCLSPQLPFGIVIQILLTLPLVFASYLGVLIARFWQRRYPPAS